MLQKANRYKVLEVFFDDPESTWGFQLRELSRKLKLAPISVKRYLEELSDPKIGNGQPLIVKIKKRHGYPVYIANRENQYFKFLKKLDMQRRIYESELLEYLFKECTPRTIILFGSAFLGEDTLKSDIDLFVLTKEKKLDLKKYELYINRNIHITFEEDFSNLSKELKNNIINGVILYGYLKVF